MKTMFERLMALVVGCCAFVLLFLQSPAHAAGTPIHVLTTERDQALLSCLKQDDSPLEFANGRAPRTNGGDFMRVKLSFDKPDAPPRVELLYNTATERVYEMVMHRLKSYRLPCLTADQLPLVAVQEFQFDGPSASAARPLRAQPRPPEELCIVMPSKRLTADDADEIRPYSKIFARLVFDGAGDAPPKVELIHSSASAKLQRDVLAYLAQYRMPCRQAGAKPFEAEQTLVYRAPASKQREPRFTDQVLSLPRFLAATQGARDEHVRFDFSTMSCPFTVAWTALQPVRANRAEDEGPTNPNRAEFLAWLSRLELRLPDTARKELIGEALRVEVPCGKLDLAPEAS